MSPIKVLILLSVFYVLAGACNAIFSKYIVAQNALGHKFSHNWFLNVVMFIGESMGIPVYYLLFKKKEDEELKAKQALEEEKEHDAEDPEKIKEDEENNTAKDLEKPEIKKILLAIPGFLDTCSTGLANIGLILLPGSIYQMLKGSLIIMTFIMSKFVVKNKHTCDHYIAIPISTLGVILVGLSAYLSASEKDESEEENKGSDAGQTLLGIILMLIAMFILSIQFIFDEFFMRKYRCHPLICIGYEGVFGFFINLFLCAIFYFIKCGKKEEGGESNFFMENMCSPDEDNVYRPENIVYAIKQIGDSTALAVLVPIAIFFMSSFNILGVSITKYGSATTRSVTDNVRSFLVWLFFLIPLNQDDLIETFSFLQLFGFLCITAGAFIYNGIFKIEERRIKRKKKINLDELDQDKLIKSGRPTTNE